MISIRSDRIHRVLRKFTGGRHARRPCFDFGIQTQIRRDFISPRLDLLNRSQLRDVTYPINKDLTSLVTTGNIRLLFKNLAASRTTKRSIVMALNKLSIDKVELTDKRVLIRYVFFARKN